MNTKEKLRVSSNATVPQTPEALAALVAGHEPVEVEFIQARFVRAGNRRATVRQRYLHHDPPPDGTDLLNIPPEICTDHGSYETSLLGCTFVMDLILRDVILESPNATIELVIGGKGYTPESIKLLRPGLFVRAGTPVQVLISGATHPWASVHFMGWELPEGLIEKCKQEIL